MLFHWRAAESADLVITRDGPDFDYYCSLGLTYRTAWLHAATAASNDTAANAANATDAAATDAAATAVLPIEGR